MTTFDTTGSEQDVSRRATVLSLISTKGGVLKTTTSGNLGALLALWGKRVLLIDADPQASLTDFFDISFLSEGGLTEFITRQMPNESCISSFDIPGLDVIVNNDRNNQIRSWISFGSNRRIALRVAVDALRHLYDYVIIDTQGANGTSDLQEQAIRASDRILMPVTPDAMVYRESRNNGFQMLEDLKPLHPDDTFNAIPIPEVFICRVTPNSATHAEYCAGIRDHVSEMSTAGSAKLLSTEIPASVAWNDAQSQVPKMPIHLHDPKPRKGQVIPCGAESIMSLAIELFGWEVVPDDAILPERVERDRPSSSIASTHSDMPALHANEASSAGGA